MGAERTTMSIVSQEVTGDRLTIVTGDGRTYMLTKADLQAFYQSTKGAAASRKSQCITWVLTNMAAALGAEQVNTALMSLDFDTSTGNFTDLQEVAG